MLPPPPTEDELAAVLESPELEAPSAVDSGYQEEEWVEHRNSEGRKYWYNTQTRISTWNEPSATVINQSERVIVVK